MRTKKTLKRLEHIYGPPNQSNLSLREKRIFLLNLSEGEDDLRDDLLDREPISRLSYFTCCMCPCVGGFTLCCNYQAEADLEAARENFLRGHRIGAQTRLQKSRNWRRLALICNVSFLGQFFFRSKTCATDSERLRPPREVFYSLFESVEKS